MIQHIKQLMMTLVLLMTAASGAWADVETATITLKCGTTEKTYENVTLPWSTTADILKAVVTDFFDVNIDAISGGDGKVVKYGNENFTVTGTFSGDATVTVSYNMGSSATITVTAPRPLMTLSDDGKTATMESMPAYDATVDYELVRDMAVQMTTKVGDGADGADYRIRLKKKDDKWEPADLTVAQVMGKFKVHDALENKDLTFYGEGAVCAISIYAVDDQDQPTGNAIAFADLEPGRYVAIAKAVDGSVYDGQTPQSNVLVLFQGYEVTVPSKEFVTYYKDEPLYADPQTSADAELYTISSVSGNQATLSSAIETAPSNTPLLVYNKGNEDKTFLLIPTDQEPNLQLIVYPGFIGTLTATTIAANTTDQTNFALNGKQFVYVKNAIAIGANKAYLSIQNSNARQISLVFDETTKITNTNLTNLTNGDWYDLNGRKLDKMPTKKGVYILNGKKVVVR